MQPLGLQQREANPNTLSPGRLPRSLRGRLARRAAPADYQLPRRPDSPGPRATPARLPQAIAKLPGLSSHGREQATLSGDQLPVQFPDGLTARARLYRAAQPSRLAIVIPPPPSIRKRSPAPALPSPSSIPYRATPSIRSAANSKTSMRAGFSTARPDSSAKLCPASKPLRPPPPRYRSTSTAVGPPC